MRAAISMDCISPIDMYLVIAISISMFPSMENIVSIRYFFYGNHVSRIPRDVLRWCDAAWRMGCEGNREHAFTVFDQEN